MTQRNFGRRVIHLSIIGLTAVAAVAASPWLLPATHTECPIAAAEPPAALIDRLPPSSPGCQ